MQDEWAKHGTCAYDSPETYYSTIEGVVGKLHLPDMVQMSGPNGVRASKLLKAFTDINPGLTPSAMQLNLGGNRLNEVHVCYDHDLAFRDCDPGADAADSRKILITKRP